LRIHEHCIMYFWIYFYYFKSTWTFIGIHDCKSCYVRTFLVTYSIIIFKYMNITLCNMRELNSLFINIFVLGFFFLVLFRIRRYCSLPMSAALGKPYIQISRSGNSSAFGLALILGASLLSSR
jgi:hypothetical protein